MADASVHRRKAYEDQGLPFSLQLFDEDSWGKMTCGDSPIPQSADAVRDAIATLKASRSVHRAFRVDPSNTARTPEPAPGDMWRTDVDDATGRLSTEKRTNDDLRAPPILVDDCHNHEIVLINLGLGNPALSPEQRDELLHDLDGDVATFEGSHLTEHFELRWTQQSQDARNNLVDTSVVSGVAARLERAFQFFEMSIGRAPYRLTPATKISVVFRDLPEGSGRADPPEGPIVLNAMVANQNADSIESVATHELFHKLQYAYGYRGQYLPGAADSWFFEGTAGLAEVFLCSRVSSDGKLTTTFADPKMSLYSLRYASLPFWLFGCYACQSPHDAIRALLEGYQASGQVKSALNAFCSFVHSNSTLPADTYDFFQEYAQRRVLGPVWPIQILGVGGSVIQPQVQPIAQFRSSQGEICHLNAAITDLASHYYHITCDPAIGLANLSIAAVVMRDTNGRVLLLNNGQMTNVVALDNAYPYSIALGGTTDVMLILSSGSPRAYYDLTVSGQ